MRLKTAFIMDPAGSFTREDTICAPATAGGTAAISIIRLSGSRALAVLEPLFHPASVKKSLARADSHTILLGSIRSKDEFIDQVLVSVFRAPHSYTGEDVLEISCHGSEYIRQRILELLTGNGCRLADPGEFTMRAFMNGKMDLSQAEAVGDLIAAQSQAQHRLASKQMRGGYSKIMKELRQQLVAFTSLLELELDFGEEEVEFANREKLLLLVGEMLNQISQLIRSFSTGNVLKHGIPVTIAGRPNAGKSTLLNALLNEERAIVSEIPGTTRDTIEDNIIIDGISFRFIDTAGLRKSNETIETLGIKKTHQKIKQASIVLYLFDAAQTTVEELKKELEEMAEQTDMSNKKLIILGNKADKLIYSPRQFTELVDMETIFISAKRRENLELVLDGLLKTVNRDQLETDTVVSSSRHHQALEKTREALEKVKAGLRDEVPEDLLSADLREALYHLGTITGDISTDEILGNIFSSFCIGK